jgi:alkaline phosphatase
MLKFFLIFLLLSGIPNGLYAEKPKANNAVYHGKAAKYVFLFIGDGMGSAQRTVTEKALGTKLCMDTLPVKAFVSTSPYGGGITDSAAAGTAFACGRKTRNGVLGLDPKGKVLESVAEMAKKLGWKIGIVSSAPLNHATPAAFYAHQPKRSMYNEIIKNLAVSNFDYFGGSSFIINKNKAGEALKALNALNDNNYISIETTKEKAALDPDKKYVIHSKMPYVIDRDKSSGPTLADYTRLGIKHIYTGNGKSRGFFMMVEGGKIDWSCHANDGGGMIHEVKNFDNAVKVALDFYKEHPDSTTIIVTADHETGGLHFPPDSVNSADLKKQKCSYAVMSGKINEYKKEKLPFKKVLPLLQANYGIKKFSPEEMADIHKSRIAVTGTKKAGDKIKILYGEYKPLLLCIQRIFNERCGLKWSGTKHTASAVPLDAIGVGSGIFAGYYENDQVARKLKSLISPTTVK